MGARAPRMGGGFGGFTPNPTVPYPGGRVLSSDVQQASDALNFGGAVARPGPTMTPSPSPTPNIVMDPSGAGYVSSGLSGTTLESLPNQRFVSDRTDGPNGTNEDVAQGVPSRGGKSPTLITDPNEDWVGTEGGGPQIADSGRSDGLPSGPGPGDGPALYEDPTQQPSATITTAGGQPRETPRYAGSGNNVAGFGGNMSLGQFLSTPLSLMLFGGNRFQPTPPMTSAQGAAQGTVSYANTSYEAGAGAEGVTPPDVAAMSEPQKADAFAAAEAQGARDDVKNGVAVSPDVRAALPAEGQPIGSAPQDVRFAQNSGTGNWTADQTAKSFLGWNPADAVTNDNSTSDEGQTRFRTPMTIDAEGAFSPAGPIATAGPSASANLFQQALRSVPMGRGGFTAQYVQQLNDWISRQRPAGGG